MSEVGKNKVWVDGGIQDDVFMVQRYATSNRSLKETLCTMTLNSYTE